MTGSVRYTRHETNSRRKYAKLGGISLTSRLRSSYRIQARKCSRLRYGMEFEEQRRTSAHVHAVCLKKQMKVSRKCQGIGMLPLDFCLLSICSYLPGGYGGSLASEAARETSYRRWLCIKGSLMNYLVPMQVV